MGLLSHQFYIIRKGLVTDVNGRFKRHKYAAKSVLYYRIYSSISVHKENIGPARDQSQSPFRDSLSLCFYFSIFPTPQLGHFLLSA